MINNIIRNSLKRVIINNKQTQTSIIRNNLFNTTTITTTLNSNNNFNKKFYSNNNNNNKEDLKIVKDILNQIKEEKEFLNKHINQNQDDFIYEKGDLRKTQESYAKDMVIEFEEQLKREDDVYNRLLTDLKNRKIEREKKLKKEKSKTNTLHYIFTILILVCIYKSYKMGTDRNEKQDLEFNEKWESLRTIVNNKDLEKEKKQLLLNLITKELSKYNTSSDEDDIKDNVESIINQFCIENKLPNQIKIENNDFSNTKI